ncbi:MAG: hypothetical protein KIS72_02990 [Luteimonas sp.]|nr:hypothetical protein [Luteimonas sp.]
MTLAARALVATPAATTGVRIPVPVGGTGLISHLLAATPGPGRDKDSPRQQRPRKRHLAARRMSSAPAAAKQAIPAITTAMADSPRPLPTATRRAPPGQAPPNA